MKKLLPSVALVFIMGIINSLAQITVTQADVASIGDTIFIARDTTPGITVGGTGQQIWNFSSLGVDVFEENAFVAPSTTPSGANFPTSNLAIDRNNGTVYSYATSSSTELNIDGFDGDFFGIGQPALLNFNPPLTLIQFPSSLDSSFSGTMRFEARGAQGTDSVLIIHNSNYTKIMDAYGMLTTPDETYDALRQYTVDITNDSIMAKGPSVAFLPGCSTTDWCLVPAAVVQQFLPAFQNNPNIDTAYSYNWYANGEGMAVVEVRMDKMGNPVAASYKITKLTAGPTAATNSTACTSPCDGTGTATAISGTAPYSYKWDAAAGNQTNAIATGLCAGTYSVTITDAANDSAFSNVTISEPTITAIASAVNSQSSTSATGSASVTASGGTAPYTYLWSNSGTTATIDSLNPGTYTVTISDSKGCSQTASATVGTWPVGIKEISASGISVYPNPSDGKVFVNGGTEPVKKISVFNLLGETVFQSQQQSTSNIFSLDISNLENGIYFVKIETENNTVTKKINMVK